MTCLSHSDHTLRAVSYIVYFSVSEFTHWSVLRCWSCSRLHSKIYMYVGHTSTPHMKSYVHSECIHIHVIVPFTQTIMERIKEKHI